MAHQWQEIVAVLSEFEVCVAISGGNGQLTGVAGSWVGGPAPPQTWPAGADGVHTMNLGPGAALQNHALLINVAAARTGGPELTLKLVLFHLSAQLPGLRLGVTELGPRAFAFAADQTCQVDLTLDLI